MTTTAPRIKDRERTAILQSLRAGVVPRVGLHHVQVGRKAETAAILKDLETVGSGGAAIRFVIGRFGAGKSFFLNLASAVALEKGFVVARADMTLDRRLHGSGGQARALFTELLRNLSTKAKPEGGALEALVERWLSEVDHEVTGRGGDAAEVEAEIARRLRPLQELVSGFDFANVLTRYHRAWHAHDEATSLACLRWLRAEFDTKTEARQALGVRAVIDDAEMYDYLKLFARFVRIAGYSGLVVALDEMVVISHRFPSARARAANYETILRMVNDCLQGHAEGLMLLFSGTDEFLQDRRRGLFSYEALATRLAPNQFARDGVRDLSGPVILLENLSPEDVYVLLHRIRNVFASGDPNRFLIPDEGLKSYLDYCGRTLGDDYFRTPRETVTRFVGLLNILEQDPAHDWRAALGHVGDVRVAASTSAEAAPVAAADGEDDLVEFKL